MSDSRTRSLRLLHVEDSESDAGLIARQLSIGGYDVCATRVQTADDMRTELARGTWDAVICDYRMPSFDAPAALTVLQETGRDIPFIVVSGTIGEDVAVAMMKAGAHDYLMKGNLARLASTVEREVREAATREQHRQAVDNLRRSEAQLALALDATDMGHFDLTLSGDGDCFCSDAARRHLGLQPEQCATYQTFLGSVHPEDRASVTATLQTAQSAAGGGHYSCEYRTTRAVPGHDHWVEAHGRVMCSAEREPVRTVGVVRDVTEEKRARQNLQLQLQMTARITEQSTEAIFFIDLDDRVLFVNSEVERAFGFTFEDFQVSTPHALMHHHHPDGRVHPASECRLSDAIRAGGVLRDFEDAIFHKDGSLRDISINAGPVMLEGTRIGTVFNFRDITERKRAERALRQSDERFRRMFDADVMGITITDRTHFVEYNDHFLRLLGYTREEFQALNPTWRSLVPAEYDAATERALQSIRSTGICSAFEKECVRKDGSRVPVLMAAVTLDATDQSRLMCFVVDQTERKSLENQFRQAQKLESIGQLAGGIAHDFNNLLTVIMGYSRMVRSRMDAQSPLGPALDEISAAGRRAASLTSQLLTFSRLNHGTPADIVLDEVVADTEKMLRRLIGEDVAVIVTPQAAGACIHADPVLIGQVLMNLAVNARDAMPEGGSLRIETLRQDGGGVVLIVQDNGTGMTPEVQAHVFEPFFTTKGPGQGTGLGLSTVYGIVKQAGGSVSIDSVPGRGTSMRIIFPEVRNSQAQIVTEMAGVPARGTGTILLVEDEAGVRRYVRETLQENGYRVLEARTGSEALEISRQQEIDLLVTDLVLPGMNGEELIRRFSAESPGVPVVRMSGYPGRMREAIGAKGIELPKPFTGEQLLQAVADRL